jgi:serine protease Do
MAENNLTEKKSNKALIISIVIVVGVIGLLGIGVGGGMYLQNALNPPTSSTVISNGTDGNTTVTEEESSIAAVAEKVSPSVVSIVGVTQTQSYFRTSSGESAGTGIIVSSDGYVMTNNHVIENASDISIVDSNGARYNDVEIIGRDPLNDIAFLKISSDTTFTAAELGNSATLRIGQQVVAIGNALGQYSNTVTSGIVSGTGRPITAQGSNGQTETLTDLIQTDTSINPGNSGGPLVNMAGQVIGINTAIVEDANGIGFAIPVNATKGILEGVLENGEVTRAYLGVNYLSVTPDVAEEYDLSVSEGAYIYASGNANPVAANSPASHAGLEAGDIITKIGDSTLGKAGSLSSVIGQYRPGSTVTLTYIRDGQTRTTDVTFTAYSQ